MTTTTEDTSGYVIQDDPPELVANTDEGTRNSTLPDAVRSLEVGKWLQVPSGKRIQSVRTAVSKIGNETGRTFSVRKAKDQTFWIHRLPDISDEASETSEAAPNAPVETAGQITDNADAPVISN